MFSEYVHAHYFGPEHGLNTQRTFNTLFGKMFTNAYLFMSQSKKVQRRYFIACNVLFYLSNRLLMYYFNANRKHNIFQMYFLVLFNALRRLIHVCLSYFRVHGYAKSIYSLNCSCCVDILVIKGFKKFNWFTNELLSLMLISFVE